VSQRFDICTPRKGRDDKTYWTRIGTAWQNDKGIQLVFDALPIADSEGRVVANLFEPREANDRAKSAGNDRQQSQQRSQSFADAADPIPF
jgi:hypothetical protein